MYFTLPYLMGRGIQAVGAFGLCRAGYDAVCFYQNPKLDQAKSEERVFAIFSKAMHIFGMIVASLALLSFGSAVFAISESAPFIPAVLEAMRNLELLPFSFLFFSLSMVFDQCTHA